MSTGARLPVTLAQLAAQQDAVELPVGVHDRERRVDGRRPVPGRAGRHQLPVAHQHHRIGKEQLDRSRLCTGTVGNPYTRALLLLAGDLGIDPVSGA